MKYLLSTVLCMVLVLSVIAQADDDFDRIKNRLAEAGCVRLEFVSIIESEIFDLVDSMRGTACLASDGRYYVTLGPDNYLYDGRLLYSFSHENNQVLIEEVGDTTDYGREITFVTRLDEFYETIFLPTRNRYRLFLRSGITGDLPDSMTVVIDGDPLAIRRIEFYDINDEFNRIELLSRQLDSVCADDDFIPAFPDSAETVKLF
ncbi:MAG: outer membrane lipoprotein carrier protein LolA [candidate division Zixibacteria bacterium]|nr:outer membrane lipoprotein carrier protein LolA [candidate division Zixibacteria bacterium]